MESQPQPKHREISRQLLAEIGEGKFATSGRLPTEMELVKRFGVSRPTVARALRDLQNEGLVERRVGSGTYMRKPSGKSNSLRRIGLLIPGLGQTEIFEMICGELASLARAQDITLMWGDSTLQKSDQDLSRENALQLCHQFIEQEVMGVFFTP